MIGTVMHDHPLSLSGRAGGRSGLCASRDKSRPWTLITTIFSRARSGLAVLLVFALLLGSAVNCSAAERWLDGDALTSAQTVEKAAQAPSEQGSAAKGHPAGVCTGHCAAHAFGLPAQPFHTAAPTPRPADWRIAHDQWAQASRPARLERPPRV